MVYTDSDSDSACNITTQHARPIFQFHVSGSARMCGKVSLGDALPPAATQLLPMSLLTKLFITVGLWVSESHRESGISSHDPRPAPTCNALEQWS